MGWETYEPTTVEGVGPKSVVVGEALPTGTFVQVPDYRHVGKLVQVEDRRAEVSFFHSLALRETEWFEFSQLRRWFLYPQTRVYVRQGANRWRAGRVRTADRGRPYVLNEDGSIDYEVQLPGGVKIDVSERNLEVRCLRPQFDPAEVLAMGGGETQFFHDRRWPTVEALIRLQAAGQGLSGLTSAAVEFVPHQVAVVQRVLQDPLPRYLLADEVGLGKTIEAGAILRQWLIDDPSLDAVVLVPSAIVEQWRAELANRFQLTDGRVQVRSHEQAPSIQARLPQILIIDEAHRLTSADAGILGATVAALARAAPRLLLLSATPALADERAFFGLLQLLDPDNYRPSDFKSFRQRFERRQEYGRLLLGLRPDAAAFLLKQKIDAARRMFPNDPVIQDIVQRFPETKSGDERSTLCISLRDHIADTYRIHQRVVRGRRSDCAFWFQPRGPVPERGNPVDARHVRVDADEDVRVEELAGTIEDWRVAACAALSKLSDPILERALAVRCRQLVDSLGQGVNSLASTLQSLSPVFGEEATLLDELRRGVCKEVQGRTRAEVAAHVAEKALLALQRAQIKIPKVVCFASSPVAATALAAALEQRLLSRMCGAS